ncbi:hypothetical protein K227x_33990 [Rubripirellula lacrimiformis]|uniref:Uncharacterized protein n=2 Tax=Rubripirellula lacrimiformis TaxID=1930273 RepID=A0A517ND10_9BACT|nr:hypothetical protein K227x_33990 [Rubripirellula lacrimiformis]
MQVLWENERAEGRVYEAETDEPFHGSLTYYWFRNRSLEAEHNGVFRAYFDGRYFTDSDGRFRIPVMPTPGIIAFSTGNRDQQRMSAYSRGYGEWELAKYRGGRSPDKSHLDRFSVPCFTEK